MEPLLHGEIDLDGAIAQLLPKQREFLNSRERFAAYYGGFGSGKSVAGCLAMILLGREIPHSQWIIGRLAQPALQATTATTFQNLFPREWLAKGGNKMSERGGGRILANNGAEYLFRHLDVANAEYLSHLNSLNLTGFFMDEASECPEQSFLTLAGRLRRKTNPLLHFGRLGGNPAGQDWAWHRFFNPSRSEKIKKWHKGITAPTTENTTLPPEYIESMLCVFPEDWQQRFIYGNFADFTDTIYKDWDELVHVYDGTVPHACFAGSGTPPPDWPVIVGVDIGGVDPWAWLFLAIAPNGFLFLFDEIYESGILIESLATDYHHIMEGRKLEGIAYDYENQQAAYELGEYGIGGSPAVKDIKPGIFKIGQYLHPDPRLTNPFTGISPAPRLYVSSRCANTAREIARYKWAKDRMNRPTGEPADKDNHCPDALRYAIHTFRPEPAKLPPPTVWQNPKLDENSRMYHYLVHKHDERMKQHRMRRHFGYSQSFPRF